MFCYPPQFDPKVLDGELVFMILDSIFAFLVDPGTLGSAGHATLFVVL